MMADASHEAFITDEQAMRIALEEAAAAAREGEVPIGAVVVYRGEVIARAHNARERDDDPSAHAEFMAMIEASRRLGRWRLSGCTVYVTLEPCPMCAGLMVNSRIDRCVYGARDAKGGALGSLYDLSGDGLLNHAFPVTEGVLADECASVLRDFFADRRRTPDPEHDRKRDLSDHLRGVREASDGRRPLRVLLAVDSYKGSASSEQVEAWIAEGIRRVDPAAQIDAIPLADGGEGTVMAMAAALDGEMRSVSVSGPLGESVAAEYLLTADGTAVIEMSAAAGMHLSDGAYETAVAASTFGVGEMVLDAVRAGARKVCVGLGGSATTDGGAGFLRALGALLLDESGAPVRPGLAGLAELASIDLSAAIERVGGVELVAWTDVDNPLVGARGAVRVFGPQKGLVDLPTPRADVPTLHDALDRRMVSYAGLLDEARVRAGVSGAGRRFRSVAGVPGAGAAGGLGAALLSIGARLASGVSALLDATAFDERAARADLVVTGEGMIDSQTASGKAPVGVASRARKLGRPVIAVVGGRDIELGPVYGAGIDLVIPALRSPMPLDRAMEPREVRRNLVCAGESAARAFMLSR